MTRLRSSLPLLCLMAALAVPGDVAAQSLFPFENGQVLEGVERVDARAFALTWFNVDRNEESFDQNAQQEFELSLRRDGIQVDDAAPNFLYCKVSASQSDAIVTYAWRLEFYGFNPEGLNPLLWEAGGIVTIGSDNFSGQVAVEECSDAFANEWLKWNPARGDSGA